MQAISKGIETFHVPEGEGHNVFTITFSVNEDGSITLPSDFTAEQQQALQTYLTYNNEHLGVRRGNHLSVMPDDKAALLDKVIDTLKSSEQVERERITTWVLQQHAKQEPAYRAFISWFEDSDNDSPYHDEWVAEGACSESDSLYDVHVTESYDGTYSYRQHQTTTRYVVAVQPDTALKVIHSIVEKQDREEDEE